MAAAAKPKPRTSTTKGTARNRTQDAPRTTTQTEAEAGARTVAPLDTKLAGGLAADPQVQPTEGPDKPKDVAKQLVAALKALPRGRERADVWVGEYRAQRDVHTKIHPDSPAGPDGALEQPEEGDLAEAVANLAPGAAARVYSKELDWIHVERARVGA